MTGNFAFSVTAIDSTTGMPGQITQSYTLSIVAPDPHVTPATLPGAPPAQPTARR